MAEKLELFYFPECPYCQRVLAVTQNLDAQDFIELRDIHADDSARQTLVSIGGKQQVPCLFIDGEPLYESGDIVNWLQQKFA